MNLIKFLGFIMIMTLLVTDVQAQFTGGGNRDDNEEIINSYLKGITKNETPTNVKGSPYLNSKFQQANLFSLIMILYLLR
jgi:hypothetical protein